MGNAPWILVTLLSYYPESAWKDHGYRDFRDRQEMILTYNHKRIGLFRRFHRAIVRQIPGVEKTVRLNVSHGRKQRFLQTGMFFFQLPQNIA